MLALLFDVASDEGNRVARRRLDQVDRTRAGGDLILTRMWHILTIVARIQRLADLSVRDQPEAECRTVEGPPWAGRRCLARA